MPSAAYFKMYPKTGVQGLEEVVINLNRQIGLLRVKSERGLIMALLFVRRDMEKTEYTTPVDLGNLRSSWFITAAKGIEPPDNFNKSFVDVPNAKKPIKAARMAADHAAVTSAMSAEASAESKPWRRIVIAGYSAFYAVFVHENLTAHFKRKEPAPAGPKWFEDALNRNTYKIVGIVANHSRIK